MYFKLRKVLYALTLCTYILTEWEGRTGIYLARDLGVLEENQILSRPAQPNSDKTFYSTSDSL